MKETKFDCVTGIEKELILLGYKRCKFDYVKKQFIEMELSGNTEYYFSSMRHLCFYYLKDDIVFIVGLHESGTPPMLCGCNKPINFNGELRYLLLCRSVPVYRMLEKIGNKAFIQLVETNSVIDFDMKQAEKEYYQEISKPKQANNKVGYTYESKTGCF